MTPTTKVLALPNKHAPGERGRFIDADAVARLYFKDFKVRGKKASPRFIRNLLRPIVVRISAKTSGYWTKDVEEFLEKRLKARGRG